MANIKVGLQLIIYGERPQRDLDGVLAEVASAGYVGVETGNLHEHYPPEAVASSLTAHGLQLAGVHTAYPHINDAAQLQANLDFLAAHDGTYLMCSDVAERDTRRGYEQSAEVFNTVGRRCADAGVTFCFHHHNWEFNDLGGTRGIDILAELTDAAVVKFCVDVYWVFVGGDSPARFIDRHADRVGYFHFKDGAPGSFAPLGEGQVPLKEAFAAAQRAGIDWLVAEQDLAGEPPIEAIRKSRAYLRQLGV